MFTLSQQPKFGSTQSTLSQKTNSNLAGNQTSTTTTTNQNQNQNNENLFLVAPFGGQVVSISTNSSSNSNVDKDSIESLKIKEFKTKPNTKIGFRWSSDNQLTVFNFSNQNNSFQNNVSKSLHRFNLFQQTPDARKVKLLNC